jgi:hypothetical protein
MAFQFPALAVSSPSHSTIQRWDGTSWSGINVTKPTGLAQNDSGLLAVSNSYQVLVFNAQWEEVGTLTVETDHDIVWNGNGFVVCQSANGALVDANWLTETTNRFQQDLAWVNGIAEIDGAPRYITAPAGWSTPFGWRNGEPSNAGFIYDLANNTKVVEGLLWPHSPRWQDGALWFIESGTNSLRKWTPSGTVETVAPVLGFGRGLTWCQSANVWLVCTSKPRDNTRSSGDLMQPAGISAITATGETLGWLPVDVNEIYDVVVL